MNTTNWRFVGIAALSVAITSFCGMSFGQAAATQPAATSAPTEEQRATPFLKLVKESDDPATVVAAYSKAAAIQGDNDELHLTYIRRMIKFGLPQYASSAAAAIVQKDPKNGMALGLVGYAQGKKGNFGEAMSATIRAAGLLPEDKSILNNAGQLLAWYDNTLSAPEMSDNVKRTIDQMKSKWAQNEAFSKSYARVIDAYNQREKMDQALGEKISAAETSILDVQRNLLDLEARLQSSKDQINGKLANLEYLRRSISSPYMYSGWPMYWPTYQPPCPPGPGPVPPGPTPPGPIPPRPGPCPPPNQPCYDDGISFWGQWGDFGLAASFGSYSCWGMPYMSYYWGYPVYSIGINSFPYSQQYAQQVQRELDSIGDLRKNAASLQADRNALALDFKNKQADLGKLKAQTLLIDNLVQRNFRWDPPMVDGVLYNEADGYVMKEPKEKIPSDPEGEAETLYKLADLHFGNSNYSKAMDYLDKIRTNYPNTAAAKKADEMLSKIPARTATLDNK